MSNLTPTWQLATENDTCICGGGAPHRGPRLSKDRIDVSVTGRSLAGYIDGQGTRAHRQRYSWAHMGELFFFSFLFFFENNTFFLLQGINLFPYFEKHINV